MAKSGKFGGTLILILCIAGAGIGGYYFWKRGDSKPPEVATTVVARGDIIQSISATGILQSPTSVDVSSQISGQIREVFADYNQPVKKGDVLARLDPATYESRLRQAEANLASTTASNTLARLNADRIRELRAKNLVSQQEVDQSEAQLAQSNAQLLTSKATVEDAKVNLDRCTIYAPIDGVVLDRQCDVGKTVAASLNAPTLFTLVSDLTKMQISADVAEADIGNVSISQEVTFFVDAYPGRQFRGKVKLIRNLPKTAQSVVVYSTIIEVANEGQLKPGMTATVNIITAQRTGVLRVANAALRARIPEKFLPPKPETAAPAAGSSSATATTAAAGTASASSGGSRPEGSRGGGGNEQIRALMQEAGVTFTRGQPMAPADLEKIKKLASEKSIELPEGFGSGGRNRSGESATSTRTVYRLASPAPDVKVEAASARFGISDGTHTEVISGLAENDTLVSSIYLPSDTSSPAASANRSPFGGAPAGGMPGMGGGGRR